MCIISNENKENIKNVIHISNIHYYEYLPSISLVFPTISHFLTSTINHKNKENIINITKILNKSQHVLSHHLPYVSHFHILNISNQNKVNIVNIIKNIK